MKCPKLGSFAKQAKPVARVYSTAKTRHNRLPQLDFYAWPARIETLAPQPTWRYHFPDIFGERPWFGRRTGINGDFYYLRALDLPYMRGGR